VTNEQFIKDVKELMKRINDKEPIREAIKRLSELL
jgi:mRNA-degrading endonuclease YafQ of YafQ-DinJ toxin-antitoxin module